MLQFLAFCNMVAIATTYRVHAGPRAAAEFDAFEVLAEGEERAKSTLHRQGNLEGGDSNYFRRPIGRWMKFAAMWHFPHITVLVLDDDFEFAPSLSDQQVETLVRYDAESWTHSLFAIGD